MHSKYFFYFHSELSDSHLNASNDELNFDIGSIIYAGIRAVSKESFAFMNGLMVPEVLPATCFQALMELFSSRSGEVWGRGFLQKRCRTIPDIADENDKNES